MRRFVIRHSLLAALLAVSVLAAACGGTPTSPTTSTPPTMTDSFTGSFASTGGVDHSFTVSLSGRVTITLTSVSPLSTMALGVGIGTWNGTSCSVITKNDNAKSGSTALTGTEATAGTYCIRVYDSGNVPAAWTVTYSVDVVHP